MEDSERYMNKIASMQKYVPLLSKLMKELEEINESTLETTEKINQLKILQKQLCDPKPGILLEELNKCEQVLENLFETQNTYETNEKNEEEKQTFTSQDTKQESTVTLNETSNAVEIENKCTEQSEKCCKSFDTNTELKSTPDAKHDNNLDTQTVSNAINGDSEENKTIPNQVSCLESSKSSDADEKEKDCSIVQDNGKERSSELANSSELCNKTQNQNAKEQSNLDDSFDESRVEIIEFSEIESENESEDDGELIVPDDESPFIEQPSVENQENFEQNEVFNENLKTSQKQETVNSKDDSIAEEPTKQDTEITQENVDDSEIPEQFENPSCNEELKNDNVEKESTQKSSPQNTPDLKKVDDFVEVETNIGTAENMVNPKETSIENNDSIDSKEQKVQPLSPVDLVENKEIQNENQEMETDECASTQNGQKRSANKCSDEFEAKKQKVSHLNDNNEECSADPLAIDNENATTSTKKADCTYDNNNDDVEIIEQLSSPILIESDDEENLTEPIQKIPIKRPALAFKSTNPNKIRDKELNKSGGNISKPYINIGKQKVTPIAVKRKTSKPLLPKPRTQQTNFLSNIDLQPSQQKNSNPRLFKAHLGQKSILIPNAFYGCQTHRETLPDKSTTQEKITTQEKQVSNPPSNAGSDAGHCRWLNNFLHHFCSPRNSVHNTSYLLLKRALRQEDFQRICRQRSAMEPTDKRTNNRLLCQLCDIFYVDGNHMMQRLTNVGRKFCQMAFLNILDKTISLTTDSITKAVTSRTRISAATLEAARVGKLHSNTAVTKTAYNMADLIDKNVQISTFRSAIALASQTSSSLRKRHEEDIEYCPPREITQDAAECPPRRSLRNSVQRLSTNDNSRSFTYSETEEDENILHNESNHQVQEKGEKPNVTAATEAYITQKRLAAMEERQKQAKSFETTFIENVSFSAQLLNSKQQKVSMNSTSEPFSSTLLSENNSDVFVISDDEEDIQEVEPTPHLILKSTATNITNESDKQNGLLKNTSTAIHSMSKFTNYCVLCNRTITRVICHYVNYHPNDEVFISRPSPKMAGTLLNNQLSPAAYDCLRNGLNLYIANCVFCEKKGSFTLPYWYQHFASHTGEYAFRCTGCGLKKPTRSQLAWHIRQNCTKNGSLEVTQEYDLSMLKINGYACRLCNYTQLNQGNVLRHLKNQHRLLRVDKCHWVEVILLNIPKSIVKSKNLNNTVNMPQSKPIYVQGGNNEIFEIAEIDDVDYTDDNSAQPVVVNEAECNDDWYGDPSGINRLFMNNDIDYQMKND